MMGWRIRGTDYYWGHRNLLGELERGMVIIECKNGVYEPL